jgi:hypothetical protein
MGAAPEDVPTLNDTAMLHSCLNQHFIRPHLLCHGQLDCYKLIGSYEPPRYR